MWTKLPAGAVAIYPNLTEILLDPRAPLMLCPCSFLSSLLRFVLCNDLPPVPFVACPLPTRAMAPFSSFCHSFDTAAVRRASSQGEGCPGRRPDGQDGEAPEEGRGARGGGHVGAIVQGEDQPLLLRRRELQVRLLQVSCCCLCFFLFFVVWCCGIDSRRTWLAMRQVGRRKEPAKWLSTPVVSCLDVCFSFGEVGCNSSASQAHLRLT